MKQHALAGVEALRLHLAEDDHRTGVEAHDQLLRLVGLHPVLEDLRTQRRVRVVELSEVPEHVERWLTSTNAEHPQEADREADHDV